MGGRTKKETGSKRKPDTETEKEKKSKRQHIKNATRNGLRDPGPTEAGSSLHRGCDSISRSSESSDSMGRLCVQSRRGTGWKCHLFCMLCKNFHLDKTHT